MKIAVIGAGRIGAALARLLTELGHEVAIANSRGPETLAAVVEQTGATAASTTDLPGDTAVVVLALPRSAIAALPADALARLGPDAVVVDVANYVPWMRDPAIPAVDAGEAESVWTSRRLGRPVVKALNTIAAKSLETRRRPKGASDRVAAPVAGDDARAKQVVVDLIDQLGFDGFDAGSLEESWRQQPGTPVYTADQPLDAARAAIRDARPEQTIAWRHALRSSVKEQPSLEAGRTL